MAKVYAVLLHQQAPHGRPSGVLQPDHVPSFGQVHLYPTPSSLYIKTEYNYVFRMRYVLLCAYTGRFGMRLVTQTWLGSGCHCRGRISKDVGGAGGAVCVGVLSGSHQQLLKCRRKGDTVLGFAGRLGPACAWEALSFGTSGRVREGQAQTQLRPSCDCPG